MAPEFILAFTYIFNPFQTSVVFHGEQSFDFYCTEMDK